MSQDKSMMTNEFVSSTLIDIINKVMYTSPEEFLFIDLISYAANLSVLLDVGDNDEIDENGDFKPNSEIDKFTDDIILAVQEFRYDDFCDLIKKELLDKEKYEVLNILIKKKVL